MTVLCRCSVLLCVVFVVHHFWQFAQFPTQNTIRAQQIHQSMCYDVIWRMLCIAAQMERETSSVANRDKSHSSIEQSSFCSVVVWAQNKASGRIISCFVCENKTLGGLITSKVAHNRVEQNFTNFITLIVDCICKTIQLISCVNFTTPQIVKKSIGIPKLSIFLRSNKPHGQGRILIFVTYTHIFWVDNY